jgi:hypothetical protein
MFTFDNLIDTYVKQSRAVLAHVQHEPMRESLNSLVDAQEAFARGLATQAATAGNFLVKTAQDAAKTDWSKFFAVSK